MCAPFWSNPGRLWPTSGCLGHAWPWVSTTLGLVSAKFEAEFSRMWTGAFSRGSKHCNENTDRVTVSKSSANRGNESIWVNNHGIGSSSGGSAPCRFFWMPIAGSPGTAPNSGKRVAQGFALQIGAQGPGSSPHKRLLRQTSRPRHSESEP